MSGQHLSQTSEAPNRAPLWKRALPIVVSLAILVFIFGWVLPQFIDYDAVFRVIGRLDAIEWIVLVVVALLRFVPEGWVFVAAQPGLTIKQGTSLFLTTNALANVPPGGLDLITRYQMSRWWGFPASAATASTVASWIFSTFGRLVLSVIAVALLTVRRIQNDDLDALALIGLLVVVVGSLALFLILRSPALATRIGRTLGRFVRFVAGLFRKEVTTDFGQLVVEFRDQSSDVLKRRWHLGLAASLTAQLASFLVLFLSLRFVGIDSGELHWTVAFAAFAIVAIAGTIPIFNVPGISEAIYIGIFNSVVGDGSTDLVAAAVFVFRILTWVAPIPLGGIAFTRWRDQVRRQGDVDLLDAFDQPGEAPV